MPGATVAARIVDGQALLLDPSATELRRMNSVGSFIWARVMERTHTVDAIHMAIVAHFEVSEAVAEADLSQFLEKLQAQGLITYKSD